MTAFRPDIEGLRAVAILLVVAYHAGVPGFAGGYIGVDVFFVLSGYLITSLLMREVEDTGSIDLMQFYARRARRLLPAVAFMLLVTTLVAAVVYAPLEQDGLANTALATATYLSNVYFTRASTDYLAAPSQTNPLLHTWSLSVEEQFYLAWPLFMAFAVGAFSRKASRDYGRLVTWTAAAALVSFVLSVYLTATRQPWAFFLSPPRAWEFAVGGLATLSGRRMDFGLFANLRKAFRIDVFSGDLLLGRVLGWVGLGGILLAGVGYGKTTTFPGVAALLPAVSTALVLRCGQTLQNRGVARLLSNRVFQEIGRLSYSWYLWHWPFLVFAATLMDSAPLWQRLVVVALSLVVAQATYHWVEQPVRRNPSLARRPRLSLGMAVAVTCVGVALAFSWKGAASAWSKLPGQAHYSQMKYVLPEIYAMGCDDYFKSSAVKECAFGAIDAPRTAVLFGDSHAGQWFPAIRRAFEDQGGWRLIVLTKSACPIVDASYFFEDIGRVYSECREWLGGSLQRIRELHPDLVLVSYASNYPFSPSDWSTGIARPTDAISASSKALLIIRDTPRLAFDGPVCLARLDWRPAFIPRVAVCKSELSEKDSDAVFALQQASSERRSNVSLVDMNADICPNQTCQALQDGIVVYRDAHHLSTAFVERLAGRLSTHIGSALRRAGSDDGQVKWSMSGAAAEGVNAVR